MKISQDGLYPLDGAKTHGDVLPEMMQRRHNRMAEIANSCKTAQSAADALVEASNQYDLEWNDDNMTAIIIKL